MDIRENKNEYILDSLKERAKELNCLYEVDEILSNPRLSLPEILQDLTRVIPSGLQFPHLCKTRIIYGNCSYQTPGFSSSPFSEYSSIKANSRVVGSIEVVYISEVIISQEGIFLENEKKLIRTIADRIAQTILQRSMEQMLREWDASRTGSYQKQGNRNEWMVILDLMTRTDQSMLLYICRKMINYLYYRGVKEVEEIRWDLGPNSMGFLGQGELNYPIAKLPTVNLTSINEKAFNIASCYLSDSEISLRLKGWIQEAKEYSLIKAVDSIDASVREIVKVIIRYKSITGERSRLYSPMEHWLVVALIGRFLSDKMEFVSLARKHLEIDDFYHIADKLIFPEGSTGKIGGKSTGLFFAQQLLNRENENHPLLRSVKVPKTWYVSTDEFKDFLHYNNLEELNVQKYKELYEIRIDYSNIIQMMKNAEFPEEIRKGLAMALDDFGDSPLIVRSSSLLEDQMGASFSGKYKSLFLANQGTKQERLEALMDAIIEVYASVFSPDSTQYRAERGLLDFHEEMGIMIQEVVGKRIGRYYFPLFAGVAFSNNEFRWSPRIQQEDGLIRLVMGLGTRAVDRVSDDFPVLLSPGQPGLRVNTVPEEIKSYAPKKIDVINLDNNRFETVEISKILKEFGHLISNAHQIVSVYQQDYVKKPFAFDIDFENDDLMVTFDGLITDTPFVKQVHLIMNILQEKLGTPVDIEFASDGENFYLLQCRPQSFAVSNTPAPIPKDISAKDSIFSANRYISNGTIPDISYIVYVDPRGYQQLQQHKDLVTVGRAVGTLNMLLPKKRFILMGPGRWGSRGDIKLGVPVSYADINNTAALIEVARQKSQYIPELSFGTHFFQDLVEANIRYLPLYPDDQGIIFNERFLNRSDNILSQIVPEFGDLEDVIRVIDVARVTNGKLLTIAMNADLDEAIAYLSAPSDTAEGFKQEKIQVGEMTRKYDEPNVDDRFWRWRYYMAECIADRLDMKHFGVKGIYVIGSTNNGTAGPGSDIDLLIHFTGGPQQREDLLQWLAGWSQCLAEMNYLKTGYATDGLLDLHLVTDEDIARKSSFAIKIGSITDPAFPLKVQ
ncbi:MAG: PEP/pyruvate-binding domain-containing protein [Bacillota bacterium]|nr:PEP/pyruvate-binding domain-containing protein [Bacillota bacterium]